MSAARPASGDDDAAPEAPAPPLDLGGGLWLVDTGHAGMARSVGVYLRTAPDGRALLIEAGPGSTVGAVQEALHGLGVGPGELAGIVVTHVHLDHAGAAGELSRWADAPVWVHPAGARHLADPSRLLASARRVYGEAMDRLWGDMAPVPEARLHTLADGEDADVAGFRFRVLHTPGHARHHLSLLADGDLFAGDAAGIRLPGHELIRPALPPPETDLEAAEASCRRMAEARPERLLLTHFGPVHDVREHLERVAARNRAWAEEVRRGLLAGEDDATLVRRVEAMEDRELDEAGIDGAARRHYKASSDAAMTVAGVGRYWRKREEAATERGSGDA